MTFARINPSGWALGDTLTHDQLNNLDIDHANAVDKTGDTVTGVILCEGSSGAGGAIQAGGTDAIIATVSSGIHSAIIGGITTTVAGGIAPRTGGSITDGGQVGGIQGTRAGGIQATVAQGITTTADGGIRLGGSTGDWVTYGSTRIWTLSIPMIEASLGNSWTVLTSSSSSPTAVQGFNNATYTILSLSRIFNGRFNGARLSSVVLYFVVIDSHTGGVPAVLPSVEILRQPLPGVVGSASYPAQSLMSGGATHFPTPGSGTAYCNSSKVQQISATCDQNNLIDPYSYNYFARIQDENGANSAAGNIYLGLALGVDSIANNAPG